MAHLYTITESDLKALAREATALFLGGTADPTGAVVKVASAFEHPLTSEHVRRVCEMTYHDAFERMFRSAPGPDRVVNFDPPDAEKVASAVRAAQVQSFSDKVASARAEPVQETTKTASAIPSPPPLRTQNAFLAAVARPADTSGLKKEAHAQVSGLRRDLRDAARQMQTEVHSAAGSEKYAFADLADSVLSVVRNGATASQAIGACLEFAKTAAVPDDVFEGMASDLFLFLAAKGVDLSHEKVAGIDTMVVNDRHPIRAQAIKVAELRGFKIVGQLALDDLRSNTAHVERELQDVLFS